MYDVDKDQVRLLYSLLISVSEIYRSAVCTSLLLFLSNYPCSLVCLLSAWLLHCWHWYKNTMIFGNLTPQWEGNETCKHANQCAFKSKQSLRKSSWGLQKCGEIKPTDPITFPTRSPGMISMNKFKMQRMDNHGQHELFQLADIGHSCAVLWLHHLFLSRFLSLLLYICIFYDQNHNNEQ